MIAELVNRKGLRNLLAAMIVVVLQTACSEAASVEKAPSSGNVESQLSATSEVSFDTSGSNKSAEEEDVEFDDEDVGLRSQFKINMRQAARLLNQATFGATKDTVREVRLLGVSGWIDQQFTTPVEYTHFDKMQEISFGGDQFKPSYMFGIMDGQEYIVNNVWRSYITAPDQLRKRIGAALHQIFVINARVSNIGIRSNQNAAASFLDMLEKNAFGNFKDLLTDVSLHPAMGHYLSFYGNEKATYDESDSDLERTVPDENYARELLQLFSIGLYKLKNNGELKLENGSPIETYTQEDIANLARVFTGWRYAYFADVNNRPYSYAVQKFDEAMVNDASKHSPEAKIFLGEEIPAGTNANESLARAIDIIFNHANVAPFISRQLIQRLVSSNPTPGYVARVAATFNNNGQGVRGDMKSVIRAILLDDEAYDIYPNNANLSTIRGKLREPMIRLTAVARVLGFESKFIETFPVSNVMDTSHGLGQSPFKSPSVFNFYRPGYAPPNSVISDNGYVAPEFQIVTGSAIPGSINFLNEFIDRGEDVFSADWDYLERKAADAEKLVLFLNVVLTGRTMTVAEVSTTEEVVRRMPVNDRQERVRAALQIITASPSFLVQL